MTSTKFEVSMEIFKFQGEPDVSVTLTGKSPAELNTALKTLETIAKTTTLYNGDSAPEAEKGVPSEPKQAAPVVSTADKTPPKKPVSCLRPSAQRGSCSCAARNARASLYSSCANRKRPTSAGSAARKSRWTRWHGSSSPAVCKKASYGRTNVEDAEIANEKFTCVCGRSVPKLTWNPAKRCYTT